MQDNSNKYTRILSVDYGDVRTGLAVSDSLGMMANGIGTIKAEDPSELIEKIKEVIEKERVTAVIVGNPINMDGSRGERSQHACEFADMLREATELPVELYDERCTTMAAHQILNITDTRGKKRKNVIDTLSAQIILQNYLDSQKYKK